MSKELVEIFEGQEVKVVTDQGVVMYNLANTAKCCGLIKKKGNNILVNWKSGTSNVVIKLHNILGGINIPPQYIEEIHGVLDEIENGDDRNSIFASGWLTRRLAMECNNDKAKNYKNWLATLDEKYSKGELQQIIPNQTQLVADVTASVLNQVVPTLVASIAGEVAPLVEEARNQATEAKKQVEEMEKLVGMRNKNTQVIGKRLIAKESDFYGRRIFGTSIEHKVNKEKVYNHFAVRSLDDIPVARLGEVLNYIDKMDLVPQDIIDKYYSNKTE